MVMVVGKGGGKSPASQALSPEAGVRSNTHQAESTAAAATASVVVVVEKEVSREILVAF